MNVDLGFPVEYWDYRFNTLAAQVGYGWLRFPGGSSGDIYNWQTGEDVAAIVDFLVSDAAIPLSGTNIPILSNR